MKTVCLVLLLLGLGVSCGNGMQNPHQISRVFRKTHQDEVAPVCQLCHKLTEKLVFDFDVTGEFVAEQYFGKVEPIINDQEVCMRCHVNADQQSINHPVGMIYNPPRYSEKFHHQPQGIKLYYWEDGGVGRVMCSTCHNPHGDTSSMLRVSMENSQLCLCCHNY